MTHLLPKRLLVATVLPLFAATLQAATLVDLTAPANPAPPEAAPPAAAVPPPSAATANRSQLIIAREYASPGWSQVVAARAGVSIAEAVATLLPPDVPGLPLEMDAALAASRVSWRESSRREALTQALAPALIAHIGNGKVTVTAAAVPPAAAPALAVAPPAPAAVFAATLEDVNLRRVVGRWAGQAGWSFRDDYWAVERDIPVMAGAQFGADFRQAVLALARTSELTDLPVKPCFYTNSVVRVVPKSRKCDQTKE